MYPPRPSAASETLLDWIPIAEQVVADAELALGFPYIVLSRFDPVLRLSQPVAAGGLKFRNTQRALRLMRRLAPNYSIFSAHALDANPLLLALFEVGEPIIAPVEEFSRGLAPPIVARTASQIAGVSHCLALPLGVDGRQIGSLSFYQRDPQFQPSVVQTARAFARQVALSVHNAELLEEGRRSAAALEAARRLISEAEERTRRNISEFLHSRVQSRLLVAEYRLGEIGEVSAEAARRIELVRTELEDLREHDVREISHQLHPEALRIGLVAALQLLASRLSGALDVHLVADQTLLAAEGTLDMERRLVAFRVIEEALGNVLKHGAAGHATVELSLDARSLKLEVGDNGQGFSARARPGLGLRCLGARVESAGGRWGIESRPGGPTRLWAELPT